MDKCAENILKNTLKPNAASHSNASWYTDTDGFLEHSPSGGSLYYMGPTVQKIIPFWGVPFCILVITILKYNNPIKQLQ